MTIATPIHQPQSHKRVSPHPHAHIITPSLALNLALSPQTSPQLIPPAIPSRTLTA